MARMSRLRVILGTVLAKNVLREAELSRVVQEYFGERGQTLIGAALEDKVTAVREVVHGLVRQRGGDEVVTVDTVREACAMVVQQSKGFVQDDIGNR